MADQGKTPKEGKLQSKKAAITKLSAESSSQPPADYLTSQLDLDLRNPRYGTSAEHLSSQTEALDYIVKNFGVTDVISSLAVNGFFHAEPLVGIKEPNSERIKILEGNRRLAACLILSGDERARNQTKLAALYRKVHTDHQGPNVSRLPVIVYEKDGLQSVLPYLGVRHIVGFREWDSYAKVAWVDSILNLRIHNLDEIMEMIGDTNKTIRRMLGGYRMVNQLVSESRFKPEQSQRAGRGSNPNYPFSWVYNALDNRSIREFVSFQEKENGEPVENPIPTEKLEEAEWLMNFLFGNKFLGFAQSITDSRQIGELAKHINSPQVYSRLKAGAKLEDVVVELRPAFDRLNEGLAEVSRRLAELGGLVVKGNLDPDTQAMPLTKIAGGVSNQAKKIHQDLKEIALEASTND